MVELITKEVIKSMNGTASAACTKPLALIIGNTDKLPLAVCDNYCAVPIDEYAKDGDIERYECVYITELTCAELADIALGRDTMPVTCSVTKALLRGKRVYIMETAPEHRKYSATANKTFYQMLEGYVCKLQSYGIELIREQKFGKNLSKSAIADNSVDKVITESLAYRLIKKDGDVISLRKGTVLTPSAKDVFNHSDKKVEFVD